MSVPMPPKRKANVQARSSKKQRRDTASYIRKLEAEVEAKQATLARLEGWQTARPEAEEQDDAAPRDEHMNRVVVKFFWTQLGKPTDPEEWKHRNGVISVIRRRMGAGASAVATVERTLKRLYTPSTEVAKIASGRRLELRAEAQRLCGE